jgi:hypothetical protein
MNGIRRGLLVLGLTVAVTLGTAGSTAPAQATFADSAAVSTTISTGTVAAPTRVEAKWVCTTTPEGTTTTEVKIEWWRSTSPGVTGYLITVHEADGSSYELARVGPTDEIYYHADEQLYAAQPDFSVTTLTSYGWTAQSLMAEVSTC